MRTFGRKVLFFLLASSFAWAQEQEEQPATNLDIFRLLAGKIAERTLREAAVGAGEKLHLSVLPKESAWYIEGGIYDYLRSAKFSAGSDSAATLDVEFGMSDARVHYANPRRDGFFGPRVVDRTVQLRLAAKVVNRQTGALVLASDLMETRTDTLAVSDVASVENPVVKATQGTLPREGFFSNFAEPLILIGSIAVGVLLLFHVRS